MREGFLGRLLAGGGILAASGSIDWRPPPLYASGFPEPNPHTLLIDGTNPHGEMVINGNSGEERANQQDEEEIRRIVAEYYGALQRKDIKFFLDRLHPVADFAWQSYATGYREGWTREEIEQAFRVAFSGGEISCVGFEYYVGDETYVGLAATGLFSPNRDVPDAYITVFNLESFDRREFWLKSVGVISKEWYDYYNARYQEKHNERFIFDSWEACSPPEGESQQAAEQALQGIESEQEKEFRKAVLAYAEPVENQDSANVPILNIQFLWNVYGYKFGFWDHIFRDEARAVFDKAFARGKPQCVSFKHLETVDFDFEGHKFSLPRFKILFRNLSAMDRQDLTGYAIATTSSHPRDSGFTIIEELTQADLEALQGELATWTPCRPQETATEKPRVDETPVRLLILIPGANTPTRTDVFPTGETGAFVDITLVARKFGYNATQWPIYSRNGGVVNDKGEWEPNPATCEDTGRSIEEQVETLHQMVLALKEVYPNGEFVLTGHSLGGVVGFEYVKKYPEDIAGVITFSSPVDGLDKDLMREVANRLPLRDKPCVLVNLNSPAITQLQEWSQDAQRPRENREAVLELLRQGTVVVVAGNSDCDAVIAGLRECLLGRPSGNNDRQFVEIPWVDMKRELGLDISSGDSGHTRILQDRGKEGAVTEAFSKVPQLGFVPRTPQNWGR